MISPVPECIIERDIHISWQNSHTVLATSGKSAMMVRKAKVRPLELPLPRKIVTKKYCIPGGISEISTTIKDLKGCRSGIPATSPFNSPIWAGQRKDESQRVTVNYHILKQAVIPIAAALPDVVSLLEQINTYLGTWYAAIDPTNAFFLHTF